MKSLLYILLLGATAFGVVRCGDDAASTGKFRVQMTDAPGVFDSVIVTIKQIRINRSGADDASSGWIVLSDSTRRLNLLDLTNGRNRFLGELDLEPGTYQQMRLVLDSPLYVVVNGQKFNLTVPSGANTGIKLNLNATIEEGSTYTLLLDFDAGRSIRRQGNGQYRMQPVIRGVRLEQSGSIGGSVTPVEMLPFVYAIQGADTVAGSRAAADGQFKLIGLPAGSYTVAVKPSLAGYAPQTLPNPVTVVSGQTAMVGTVTLQAAN